MHHQDFPAEPAGAGSRKASYHFRRGSSGATASPAAGACAVAPADDGATLAGSSSPGLHHHHHQPQSSGAQVKKKSGFQITSVTSAQINVSGNDSLADDTESYDDMDESHTEDLSSSEMLDVPMSRASDRGVPERSSSDETLNSLHGVDTPGLTSPNEPLHPHPASQAAPPHASLVNGAVHYYHHHGHPQHRDSLGGGESSLPALPIAPLSTSSPAPKPGANLSQRPLVLDGGKAAVAHAAVPAATGPAPGGLLQSGVNFPSAPAVSPAAFPAPPPDPGSQPVGGAPSTQPAHTQAATGSRFRVVKLDTNSEPFRKGRWTCTEYYEKEVPPATAPEAAKGADAAAEMEPASGSSPGVHHVQPPHTLQAYALPGQDFTSPQAVQSPPQGPPQAPTMAYVSHPDAHLQKPGVPMMLASAAAAAEVPVLPVLPQQMPPAPASYPPAQLTAGVMGGIRPPDFIQPTAPFQNQVQPPLPHVPTPVPPSSGVAVQPPASLVPHQSHVTPAAPVQTHPPLAAAGSAFMPLTALQADLQPILTPGTTLAQASPIKASQLEDAQKLLFQHQGLLALPRLGMGTFAEGSSDASLAHIGMSAEASAFMVAAAAAGLRTQPAEGEEDR